MNHWTQLTLSRREIASAPVQYLNELLAIPCVSEENGDDRGFGVLGSVLDFELHLIALMMERNSRSDARLAPKHVLIQSLPI